MDPSLNPTSREKHDWPQQKATNIELQKQQKKTRLVKTPSTQKAKRKQEKQCYEEKAHSDPRIFYQKLGS